MSTFGSIGDLGDCIVSLPSVRALGGGTYYAMDKPNCRPFICRMPILQRLMESQPYIEAFKPHNGETIDYDFSTFREGGHPYGVTLGEMHSRWVGALAKFDEPWLKVKPSKETKGKIVIARSFRYRVHWFPWGQLTDMFRNKMKFVGFDDEYTEFCRRYGYVDYLPTNDLYEVAEAISGSEMFIGNQSAPGAVCEGLKHRSIQETCCWVTDCVYPRDNAIHCYDGALKFSCLGRDFESPPYEPKARAQIQETPPGGWTVGIGSHKSKSYDFRSCRVEIRNKLNSAGIPIPPDLDELIITQSSLLMPPPQELIEIQQAKALICK